MFWFRLRERLKHEHVEDCYKQLLKNEKFTKEELESWQKEKFFDLIEYLSANNPFYSEFIKNHQIDVHDRSQNIIELLSKFPVVDKQFIKQHYDEWLSKHLSYDNVQLCCTSGSSGVPFKFYHSPISGDYKTASKYRLYHRFGIEIDDLQLCYGTGYNSEVTSFIQKLKIDLNQRFVNKRIFVDVAFNGGLNYKSEIERINKLPIRSIWGYTSTIVEIAQYSIEHEIPIHNKKLKAIILSGEGHNEQSIDTIKKAFDGINIVDEFNSVEGFIAGNCKNGQMHLNEDTTIFEILHQDGTISQTGEGELLITSLFDKDFPFIRYRNGDVMCVTDESCRCNSLFKIMKHADGRSACVIYNGDKTISHATCTHIIPHSAYRTKVTKFQYVQNDKSSVTVKIVPALKDVDFTELETLLRNLFDQITVRFEYVDNIPKEKSGKFKDVINNVK